MRTPGEQLWLHVPTFTTGIVIGQFIEFKWNNKIEESFFTVLRETGDWVYVGEL